jgi:hypothetical protein
MRLVFPLLVILAISGCQSSWDIEDLDGDGFTLLEGDCDDADADVNPDGIERCDGVDNDCDGTADGEGAEGAVRWMPDVDKDGYGDDAAATISCEQPPGTVTQDGDCDDTNADKAPGLVETCDSLDNDCNGIIDDDPTDGMTWYEDRDSDGFGAEDRPVRACSQPAKSTTLDLATDCDDDDADVFPGSTVTEVPGDEVDQDCDGLDLCTDITCDGVPDLVVANHHESSSFDQPIWVFAASSGGVLGESPTLTVDAHSVVALDVADLDGDGYQDLVWISGERDGSDALTIAYGGAGGFPSAKRQSLAASNPRDLDVVDVDVDGWLDLVVTNYQDGGSFDANSTVYWGGTGGYSSGSSTGLPTRGGTAAVVADLDDDGDNDVVFCNEQTGINPTPYAVVSTIYWGGADRLNATRFTPISVTGCRDVVAVDLDDDDLLDLAFASWRTRSAATSSSPVFYNDGLRFIAPSTESVATDGAASVSAGDIDGDGLADLVFGVDATVDSDWTRPWSVHYNAVGGFGSGSALQTERPDVRHPILADLDGDGDLDVVAPAYGSGDGASQNAPTGVWTNRFPLGGSLAETTLDVGGALRVAVADVDGDGQADLMITNSGDGVGQVYVSVYFGAAGVFSTARRWRVESGRVIAPAMLVGTWD